MTSFEIIILLMLSILIPTFNYNVSSLASVLVKEAQNMGLVYELICIDDGSNSEINKVNESINNLDNCRFIAHTNNIGRTALRQLLAEKAQYQWVLFLDADVLPVAHNFLNKMVSNCNQDTSLVYGGISYQYERPQDNKLLRWKYGRKREQKSVKNRKKKPYLSIISGAFCIKKELFLMINQNLLMPKYGLDILFSNQLLHLKVKVSHIDNPVFHLGLENSRDYLNKSKEALHTLHDLVSQNAITYKATPLLRLHNKLLKLRILKPIVFLTTKCNALIETNLLSKSPNLLLFDLYRLGYFSNIKKKA